MLPHCAYLRNSVVPERTETLLSPALTSSHQKRKQRYSEVGGIIRDYVKSKVNFVNVKKMNINRLYKL